MTYENLEGQPIAFEPGKIHQVTLPKDVIGHQRVHTIGARPASARKSQQAHVLARLTNEVSRSCPDDLVGRVAFVSDAQ
ncbi:hypothetical protein AJ87_18450 [Rhizobium yanglingense]|nr:hypothetical protein AJ87_18450 [Rhizobium yanglingense]